MFNVHLDDAVVVVVASSFLCFLSLLGGLLYPPKAFVPSSLAAPGKRGMNIMNSFMNASCLQVDRWLKV